MAMLRSSLGASLSAVALLGVAAAQTAVAPAAHGNATARAPPRQWFESCSTCSVRTQHAQAGSLAECQQICDADAAGCDAVQFGRTRGSHMVGCREPGQLYCQVMRYADWVTKCYTATAAHCRTDTNARRVRGNVWVDGCDVRTYTVPPPPPPPPPPTPTPTNHIVALRDPRSMNLGDRRELLTLRCWI